MKNDITHRLNSAGFVDKNQISKYLVYFCSCLIIDLSSNLFAFLKDILFCTRTLNNELISKYLLMSFSELSSKCFRADADISTLLARPWKNHKSTNFGHFCPPPPPKKKRENHKNEFLDLKIVTANNKNALKAIFRKCLGGSP